MLSKPKSILNIIYFKFISGIMERRNISLEWSKDIFFSWLIFAFTATVGYIFSTTKQQIQQNANCKIWMSFNIPPIIYDFSNSYKLCSYLSTVQSDFNFSSLEWVDSLYLGFWTFTWWIDIAWRSNWSRFYQDCHYISECHCHRDSHCSNVCQ